MQGRLVRPQSERLQAFPRDGWEREFARASRVGVQCIEWIYDRHGEDVNPLRTDAGIARMHELSRQSGVSVHSLCADYLIEEPLIETDSVRGLDELVWLIGRCALADIRRIVLPFVDRSAIRTDEEKKRVVRSLEDILPTAAAHGIELHLETSLAPETAPLAAA